MTYISLLRGINVSGNKKILMAELKSIYETMGFENVLSYIQSGNVIFSSIENDELKLCDMISDKIQEAFGYDVKVIIRSKNAWEKVIGNNPFIQSSEIESSKLYVTFLSQEPLEINRDELDKIKQSTEKFMVLGKEIYFYCPDGYGRTKLSNNLLERKLKVTATTRNWNTVKKLFELANH